MKKKNPLLNLSLVTLLLMVCMASGLVFHTYRKVQANHTLVLAIQANDTTTALAALDAGADADFPRESRIAAHPFWFLWLERLTGLQTKRKSAGPSLLAQAVQHNNTALVKALLKKGATDVEGVIKDHWGEPVPLLAVAAGAGNLEICQALVAHGADVNAGESHCALKMAAERGRGKVILFLFQRGAKLDTPDELSGECALMGAARSGDAQSVQLLLAHGANAKGEGRFDSVLSAAVFGGNLAVIKRLVEAGADVNGGGAYAGALQDAAEKGDVQIVRYLISKGARVNGGFRWNRTPLLEAVKEGHAEVVKLLLAHGADWRPKEKVGGNGFIAGADALQLALSLGHRKIVQMLKKAGAKE